MIPIWDSGIEYLWWSLRNPVGQNHTTYILNVPYEYNLTPSITLKLQ